MDTSGTPAPWWHRECETLSNLKAKTEAYWDQTGSDEQRLRHYVETLLPCELRYAAQQNVLHPKPCDILVLLVGYSLEPLCQAVGVFSPRKKIVLLMNQRYESSSDRGRVTYLQGKYYGQEVREYLKKLVLPHVYGKESAVTVEIHVVGERARAPDLDLTGDRMPAAIFQTLCTWVLSAIQEGERVVVDITGGKKSMDVGAFLFAAYAGIPISYVDFERYHPRRRRPYGYTCQIGCLENPYASFALREWEEVRRFYAQYHFRRARAILTRVVAAMTKPWGGTLQLFTAEQVAATERLGQVLAFYAAWDEGNYEEARSLLDKIHERGLRGTFSPPAIVAQAPVLMAHVELSELPRRRPPAREEAQRVAEENDFLMSNVQLLIYAHDELAKIKRLVAKNEDHRSALLRAVGLDELLLKARLMRVWNAGKMYVPERNMKNAELPVSLQESLREALLSHSGPTKFWRQVLEGQGGFIPLNGYRVYPDRFQAPKMRAYDDPAHLNLAGYANPYLPEALTDLRNQAIHKYQYVAQDVAEAAVRLAEANLKEFEDRDNAWLALAEDGVEVAGSAPGADCLAWDEVCAVCGVDFLPF